MNKQIQINAQNIISYYIFKSLVLYTHKMIDGDWFINLPATIFIKELERFVQIFICNKYVCLRSRWDILVEVHSSIAIHISLDKVYCYVSAHKTVKIKMVSWYSRLPWVA